MYTEQWTKNEYNKVERQDVEAEPGRVRKETQESLEQSFTPSLARRLSRTLIEQTAGSPSASYETRCRSPSGETSSLLDASEAGDRSTSTVSDQTEYRQPAGNRTVRRANSLLERSIEKLGRPRASPRRTVSLFDGDPEYVDEDGEESVLARRRESLGLEKWYKEAAGKRNASKLRRESFRSYRTDKIQEEAADNADNGSVSECTSASVCDSNTNLLDATSSVSAKSYESSSTESNPSSNLLDYKSYKSAEMSRNFENRLLAAENLIKESKLKNLGPAGDRNLSCNYRDTDKCEKRSLISMGEASSPAALSKRRSCIPSLRLRSGSLTRESGSVGDRRKSFADSLDVGLVARSVSPEKSLLGKLFKVNRETDSKDKDKDKDKEKTQKSKQRRISRFLRPDFFDTPREESRYAKEKEAQKAAENERRKSRFMKRKNENGAVVTPRESSVEQEKQREKELKNEINSLKRESRLSRETEDPSKKGDTAEESSRNGFLHSLEKKLEKLRSNDEVKSNGTTNGRVANEEARERSAPPEPTSADRASAKRAVSVEDLSSSKKKSGQNSSRSRVSSVLGLFKSAGDAKQSARSQNAILSKLKRSPPKSAKPDAGLGDDTVSTTSTSTSANASRIPTKLAKCDAKTSKKLGETKKTDRGAENAKRSPTKEAPKATNAKEKRESRETTVERETVEKTNEERESTTGEVAEKRSLATRAKKAIRASAEGGVDADKKPKRPAKKPAESSEGDSEGTKKKKIVRATKKIAKKSSDSGEDKTSEEKEKSAKVRAKKKAANPTESNASDPVASTGKAKENGTDDCDRNEIAEETGNERTKGQNPQRPNRSNLKLDLSKIPQHSFRNGTPKKDSPKSESPKASSESTANDDSPDKLMECLSKVTHRASITGNKIVIDKPLRAKDVAELKREVTECAKIIESHAEAAASRPVDQKLVPEEPEPKPAAPEAKRTAAVTNDVTEKAKSSKESPVDYARELFTPVDEPESFDSWSISSTELNHARPGLRSPSSPTSPSPSRSLYSKSDNSDSVIERIRRRSFYSRFNDKRRPSLTAPPPGLNLPTSVSLPRKFSFAGHREHRDRGNKYALSVTGSNRLPVDSRSYSLYGDEAVGLARNRSLDRSRYSDANQYVTDLKSPTELSSSYDPLRRYLRSPTFDLSASRSRYHSADFTATDHDLPAYRTPPLLSGLLLNDAHPTSSSSSSLGSSTLPRKYGSSLPEPKTVQYYEELLAPSTVDYLSTARKSPLSTEYLNRCENGYYNGNLEAQSNDAKRKPITEFPDQPTEQTRSKTEVQRSPSTSAEAATVPTDDHS